MGGVLLPEEDRDCHERQEPSEGSSDPVELGSDREHQQQLEAADEEPWLLQEGGHVSRERCLKPEEGCVNVDPY